MCHNTKTPLLSGVEKVRAAQRPMTKRNVLLFLGLTGFYRDHIPHYTTLHLPDHDKPFILRTDASDEGIGVIILQEHDGQLYSVLFASKKLLD